MKKISMTVLIVLFCSISTSAQTNDVKMANISYQPNETQWEYLVISFGTTTFGTPEKMMAYKPVGIENGSESIGLQTNLDILGRFGWELVNTIGVIAGDQELILKRKYSKDRSAKEYGLIQAGKELYLKDLQDIVQRSLKLEEEQAKYEEDLRNRPRLVDLDAKESKRIREDKRVTLENAYKRLFESTEIASKSTFNLDYKTAYSNDIKIEIKVDLTDKFLIDGNGYHREAVQKYIKSFLESYKSRNSILDSYDGISIIVKGFIKFNNIENPVGSGVASQSYSGSSWVVTL